LAIAETAGGEWPERAVAAALELSGPGAAEQRESLGVRFLGDLRRVFKLAGDPVSLFTKELISALVTDENLPWGHLNGQPLNPRAMARKLNRYDIRSVTVRQGDQTLKGYRRVDLEDAWSRYLPPPVGGEGNPPTPECDVVPDGPPSQKKSDEVDEAAAMVLEMFPDAEVV